MARTLMNLQEWFDDKGRVLVALSGGVDSALVALAAQRALGSDAIAITADYKTLSSDELDSAKSIAQEIGIKHMLIQYSELENENFVINDQKRCFYCRSELAEHLVNVAKKENIQTIIDGTNLDDLGDYRPGIKALQEHSIKSPLVDAQFTKQDVRREAKLAGLSIYDKPSNSCLASRIPWGRRVTAERLARIELAETFVKNISCARQVRVRDIDGIAKIEVDTPSIKNVSSVFSNIHEQLKMIGFSNVIIDPQGYMPGKINVIAD